MAAPLSCDQYEELLVDSLLHALETETVSAVTEHLRTCDCGRTQGTAYEAVLAQLAQAVPQQEPPTELDVHFVNPSSVFLLDKGSTWRAC